MATYNGHQEDSSGNYLLAIPNSMATTIETGTTASQAYTKGTYFYYNNRLVKATKAIASGDTLTVGTNVGYANAADELTAHLRANDTNKSEFYFDVKDGAYGFYPSASKTASEFVPFGGTPVSTTTFTIPVRYYYTGGDGGWTPVKTVTGSANVAQEGKIPFGAYISAVTYGNNANFPQASYRYNCSISLSGTTAIVTERFGVVTGTTVDITITYTVVVVYLE